MQSRNTKQKQIVSRIISEEDRPLTVNDVLAIGQEQLPSLGIATIYREINRLCAAGELQTVSIPGDQLRYEVVKQHHHHFKCNGCNKVYEIEGCIKEVTKLVPKGFTHQSHEITFYGLCNACI